MVVNYLLRIGLYSATLAFKCLIDYYVLIAFTIRKIISIQLIIAFE